MGGTRALAGLTLCHLARARLLTWGGTWTSQDSVKMGCLLVGHCSPLPGARDYPRLPAMVISSCPQEPWGTHLDTG